MNLRDTPPNTLLNKVLRIESSKGFTLKFKHPVFGELCLPIADPGAILSMTVEEAGSPAGDEITALNKACHSFVEKRDFKSAFAEAKAFSNRFPIFAHAYSLQGAFAEEMGELDTAAFHLRQSIAIRPILSSLAELGQVLGKRGSLNESLVLYRFLFENRKEAGSDREALRFIQGLLVTLTRLQKGAEMVQVADAAIADYGGATTLHYQAILGLMISKAFQPALNRLEAIESYLNPADPMSAKFAQLKQVLRGNLNAQKG